MCRPRTILAFVLLAALVAPPAGAQRDPSKTARPTGPGPQTGTVTPPLGTLRISGRVMVGDAAPDFQLLGTGGHEVSLGKQRGGWVLLVFARDKSLFGELAGLPPEMAKVGAKMLGITRERASALRGYVEKENLGFELLSDPTGEVSAIYGSFDVEGSATMPGYVLIDRKGMVKLAVLGQTFPAEQVLTLVTLTIQAQ